VSGGYADMRGTTFEHPNDRANDASDRPALITRSVEQRWRSVKMPEKLVRSVDEMNPHD